MPTYLCRAFRWKRQSIRVYVVVQDLDDAAPEWIIKRGSAQCLIESFYNLFDFLPECASPPASLSNSRTRRRFSSSPDCTTHTVRNGSNDQGRAAVAQHNQDPINYGRDQDDPTGPHPRRESSNSSRKHSISDKTQAPLIPSTHGPSVSQTNNATSPPASSQPHLSSSHATEENSFDLVLIQDWSPVKLLEEYDPNDLQECSRPYAYVADYVKRIDASCSIEEEIAKFEQQAHSRAHPTVTGRRSSKSLKEQVTTRTERSANWFGQLRDQLQRDEEIKWYVVVNGDEERAWPVNGAGSSPGTKMQTIHRAHYTHEQPIFADQNSDIETRRQQLRRELGFEDGGVDELVDKAPEVKPNSPKAERLKSPFSGTCSQMHPREVPETKISKTPRQAFRRFLFGKSKAGRGSV